MPCKIIKDKRTGEESLIPDCWSVVNHWHLEGMADREIIKEYCSCNRQPPKDDKYETKTRDEVFGIIAKLKEQIQRFENQILSIKEQVDMLESEVFCLNTVEVE